MNIVDEVIGVISVCKKNSLSINNAKHIRTFSESIANMKSDSHYAPNSSRNIMRQDIVNIISNKKRNFKKDTSLELIGNLHQMKVVKSDKGNKSVQ